MKKSHLTLVPTVTPPQGWETQPREVVIVRYVGRDGQTLFKDMLVVANNDTVLRGRTNVNGKITDFRYSDILKPLLGEPLVYALHSGSSCPQFAGQMNHYEIKPYFLD